MKSEEKKVDLLLQNLGGKEALYEQKEHQVKNKSNALNKETRKKQQPKKVKVEHSRQKPRSRNTVVAVKQNMTSNKVKSNSYTESKSKVIKNMTITLAKLKENIVQSALTVRKKMPGYVYPSRQDMLLDQKHKQDMHHRKQVEVQQQQSN